MNRAQLSLPGMPAASDPIDVPASDVPETIVWRGRTIVIPWERFHDMVTGFSDMEAVDGCRLLDDAPCTHGAPNWLALLELI